MPFSYPYSPEWARHQAMRLLDFHAGQILPLGGFSAPDYDGHPRLDAPRGSGPERPLHETCRMIHVYAQGKALGHPAADAIVDHGMGALLDHHHDSEHGGFFWSFDDAGPLDRLKQAYGHAFVLLAAASAQRAGHPRAEELATLVRGALDHFWEPEHGVVCDVFDPDWTGCPAYRGQNANMHLTEALLAAHAVWGLPQDLDRALSIAEMIINRHARACGWVVAEHFTDQWQIDTEYDGDAMFRPSGTTPGHALEWARLLIELEAALPHPPAWLPEAAEGLFRRAVRDGWRPEGGFAYTLDWQDRVSRDWRLWWPCAEGIAAAATLAHRTGDAFYEDWYARIWDHADRRLIDHRRGGWFHQIAPDGTPVDSIFPGKPDAYHALTACLASMQGGMVTA